MGEVEHRLVPGQQTQEAMAALRHQHGLPSEVAAPPAAQQQGAVPSAPPGVQAPTPPQPPQGAPAAPEGDAVVREQLANAQSTNEALLAQMAKLVEASAKPPEPTPPPEIPVEPKPKDFEEWPAEGQMKWIGDQSAKRASALAVHEAMTGMHEEIRKSMQPVLAQVAQSAEVTDHLRVRSQFPTYPYAEYKPGIDAIRKEMPALTATEAAVLVAHQKGNPAALAPPVQAPPVTTPGTPSGAAAAAGPPAGRSRGAVNATPEQLLSQVGAARRQGNKTLAGALIKEAIRQKVTVPQAMR